MTTTNMRRGSGARQRYATNGGFPAMNRENTVRALTKTDRARIKAIRERSGVKAAMREVQRLWKNDEAAENGSGRKP